MKQNFNNQVKKDLMALEETKFVFLCNRLKVVHYR